MSEVVERAQTILRHLRKEPGRWIASLATVLVVVGVAGVLRPLSQRIDERRERLDSMLDTAQTVRDLEFLTRAEDQYRERLTVPSELAEWQSYVLDVLERTDCALESMENGSSRRVRDYRICRLAIVVRGDFASLHDFVDRIERGYRLMRIDDIALTEDRGVITMRCTLRGIALARSGSTAEIEPESEPEYDVEYGDETEEVGDDA